MSDERMARIRARIEEKLSPEHFDLIDESHKHAGHAGARSGAGHFDALIVAEAFEGVRPLQRQRMVFDALGEMMNTEIHAFNMQCKAPSEI